MKRIPLLVLLLLPAAAHAELPQPAQKPDDALIAAEQTMMTDTGRRGLQQRLRSAVFTVNATQRATHDLLTTKRFDGAAVAVIPAAVREVLPEDSFVETVAPKQAAPKPPTSFFDRGLDEATSPFSQRKAPEKTVTSAHQFYLTTADWLTGAEAVTIHVSGRDMPARIAHRDDAQNILILESQPHPDIHPVTIYPPDKPAPGLVYVLLSPNSIQESLTQHAFQADMPHLYGTVSHLTARNGYPLFAATGELVGLTVAPNAAHTHASVAPPAVIDRALHPKAYDRTTVETITPQTDR